MLNRKKFSLMLLLMAFLMMINAVLFSHCQVPCGIYDDHLRVKQISEHITTIEKAMNMIKKLSGEENKNFNQIVRWITNKEEHAEAISSIISYYFLAQRIKPVVNMDKKQRVKYLNSLTSLHNMMFFTMKSKQTTDLNHIKKLRTFLEEFKKYYFQK